MTVPDHEAGSLPSSSAPVAPGPGVRTELIVLVGALSAFAPLSIDMYLPGLPQITRELGATASQVQLTLTACLAGLALGQLVAGPLSDALGRRRPLLIGLAAYTIASVLCALAPDVWSFVLLRMARRWRWPIIRTVQAALRRSSVRPSSWSEPPQLRWLVRPAAHPPCPWRSPWRSWGAPRWPHSWS
jgi:hypothetical protein